MVVKTKRKKQLSAKMSTRELIILEAERLIAQKGVEGLRLSAVADLVGIKLPSLYSHFAGRNELIGEIIMRALNSLSSSFTEIDNETPLQTIKTSAKLLVKHLAAHPAYVRLLMIDFSSPQGLPEFSEKFGPPGELEQTGLLRPLIDRLRAILEQGEAMGELRYYEPLSFFHNLLGLVLVRLCLDPRHRPADSEDEWADLVSDIETCAEDFCERLLRVSS